MRSLSLSICLWAWSLGGTVCAQDASSSAVEADSVHVDAARRALRAERDSERLQLTDTWMKHEDQEERDQLQVSRWVTFGLLGLFTGTFGVVAGANASEEGPLGATLAASAAAAVSLGLTAAALLIDDDRDVARFSSWAFVTELAIVGTGWIVAGAISDDLTSDGALLFGVFAAASYVQATIVAVMTLVYPRLFVSEHYRDYLARPDATRAQRGLDLLLERERRQRMAVYGSFSFAVTQAGAYGVCAAVADGSEARTAFAALAGFTLVAAAGNLIVQLVTRTPSENIVGGFPPPSAEVEAL